MDRTRGFLDPALETRSWDEQVAEFSRRLPPLVAHACRNAPAVRRKFEEAGLEPGDIRGLEDLPRIPITPKARLAELQKADPPFGGFLAAPPAGIARIFRSPGPIYEAQGGGEGWGWEEALFAAGFRPGDVSINTFSYHMTPGGMMFDDGLRNLGCTVVAAGVGERELQMELLRSLRVKGFVGMPSFLAQIVEKAREMGLDLRRDLALEVALVAGEALPESLRASLEGSFGLILRQGYGTAECGCLAFECYHKGGMHLTRHAIVEIADPATGKRLGPGRIGEVVVTLLTETWPLIRFGTGDLSALEEGTCSCGRRSPKLRGWLGRTDQLTKVKGLFIHPAQLQSALREFPEVARFRAVVTREGIRDVLTVRVEAGSPPPEGLGSRLERRLREVLGIGAEVAWAEPGSLAGDARVIEDARPRPA